MSKAYDALMAAMAERDQAERPRPIHEAQIATLREAFANYNDCTFTEGDIVTPRTCAPIRNPGEPHLVLEVYDDPEPLFMDDDDGNWTHGARRDMRVGVLVDGDHVAPYWVESWMFVPYEAK